MKHLSNTLGIMLLAVSLSFVACSKDDDDSDIGNETGSYQPGNIPGMGEAGGELTGTAFMLTDKIEINGGIKGQLFLPEDDDEYCQIKGSGSFVLLSLEFVNHLGKDTLLVFPAGLTFRADNIEDQNGILVQETKISLAEGQTCKTFIPTYCINQEKHGSTQNSSYSFGPITNASPMQELIQLVKNKRINYEDFVHEEDYYDGVYVLQNAIWSITDRDGLTQENRNEIQSLDDL
ncbi:MAG: thioester domain-containing protein [Moheibacter sp.]